MAVSLFTLSYVLQRVQECTFFGMGVAMRCSRNVETVLWSIRERVGVIRKKRLCADKGVHSYLPYTDMETHVLTGLRDTIAIHCGCPSNGVWCLCIILLVVTAYKSLSTETVKVI